jgi:hypothetical protein
MKQQTNRREQKTNKRQTRYRPTRLLMAFAKNGVQLLNDDEILTQNSQWNCFQSKLGDFLYLGIGQ